MSLHLEPVGVGSCNTIGGIPAKLSVLAATFNRRHNAAGRPGLEVIRMIYARRPEADAERLLR